MKIALCIKENNVNSELDDRFGRAEYFLIYDTESGEKSIVENVAKNDSGGAGGRAVRFIYQNSAKELIAPELGPKALDAIKAFEIKAYSYNGAKTADEALEKYNKNELTEIKAAGEEKKGLYRV